jgi:hypothetical protein
VYLSEKKKAIDHIPKLDINIFRGGVSAQSELLAFQACRLLSINRHTIHDLQSLHGSMYTSRLAAISKWRVELYSTGAAISRCRFERLWGFQDPEAGQAGCAHALACGFIRPNHENFYRVTRGFPHDSQSI